MGGLEILEARVKTELELLDCPSVIIEFPKGRPAKKILCTGVVTVGAGQRGMALLFLSLRKNQQQHLPLTKSLRRNLKRRGFLIAARNSCSSR